MKKLTKKDIVDVQDLLTEEIEVKEWNGSVILRVLPGNEMDNFEASCTRRSAGKAPGSMDVKGLKAELLAACILDPVSMTPMFTSEEVTTVLNKKSCKAIDQLWDKACLMNGIGPEAKKALEKN